MQHSINIGNLKSLGFVYIPPMAGVTDLAYRQLCREFDPEVILATEMLSSRSLTYSANKNKKHEHTMRMTIPENDSLTGIQIFGHEPEVMAEAALIAQNAGAKFIDINMGCPVPKIVNGNDGAALMKEPELAKNIVREVIKAVKLPVTVKMRLGWCESSINAPQLAKSLSDIGIQALTIHGRTRSQKYTGKANWQLISDVVKAVDIPVFANGDVKSLEDAKEILRVTGASGIAIARATMGKPWFSKQVNHYLLTGERIPEPTVYERLSLALKHCKLLIAYKGLHTGIQESRKHINNYAIGLPDASKLRQEINQITCFEEAEKIINNYRDQFLGQQ